MFELLEKSHFYGHQTVTLKKIYFWYFCACSRKHVTCTIIFSIDTKITVDRVFFLNILKKVNIDTIQKLDFIVKLKRILNLM